MKIGSPNKHELFSTPLYQFPAYLPQQINDELTEKLLKMEAESNIVKEKSNAGGWHSEPLVNKEDLCFQILDNYIKVCFKKIVEETTKSKCKWNRSSWAIINRKNDYNLPHSHSNANWSCVYYVDAGNKIENPKNKAEKLSGNLILFDPRGSLVDNSRIISNHDKMYEDMFGDTKVTITPTAGLLLFFPSWLMHSVLPYKGTKPRIIISMNFYPER